MASADIRWGQFIQLAERHRVIPHAFRAIERHAPDKIPPRAMQALTRRFRRNSQQNLRVVAQLNQISETMLAAGIPLTCLKGPALAMQIYGQVARRQFRDLDVLVPPEHALDAARLLNRIGYQDVGPPVDSLSRSMQRQLVKTHKELKFQHPEQGILVELHWRLGDTFSLPRERIWQSDNMLSLGESPFHVLSGNDLVLYLAWHGSTHRWKRLSWLFDLVQATRVTTVDWNAVERTAFELGIETYVALGLAMASELGNNEIPQTRLSGVTIQREIRISKDALLAAEDHFQRSSCELFWKWRMSRTTNSRIQALLDVFRPQAAQLGQSGRSAMFKRLLQLVLRAHGIVQRSRS